ncbi:MAG: stage III sporulation protein AD [Clostridia bacterium]|nr:stage III sporulation protein AD [Clostridia bacterium]
MDIVKIIGVGLIALIIIIILKQYRPEFTMYVSILAGVIILIMLVNPISGIINLINSIASRANINIQFIKILIKITGIAILTEFAVSICNDSGETAIASKIDVGGKIIIIGLSIPIIQTLMETILKVLP